MMHRLQFELDAEGYSARSGSMLRSVANDLKRNDELAEKDLSLLERWHERAILAASISEVLGEPS